MKIEQILVMIFFGILLWVGIGTLFGNSLIHPFPEGYSASDSFQHQTRIESIKQMGNYRFEAPYIVKGFSDVTGFYMPVLYHLGIMFSTVSGVPTHDILILMSFLASAVSALLIFFLIHKHNKKIAWLALPLGILLYHNTLRVAYTWGHWPAILGQLFLIGGVVALDRIDMKGMWIIFGILFGGAIMSHTAQAIFLFLIVAFYVVILGIIKLLKKKTIN